MREWTRVREILSQSCEIIVHEIARSGNKRPEIIFGDGTSVAISVERINNQELIDEIDYSKLEEKIGGIGENKEPQFIANPRF